MRVVFVVVTALLALVVATACQSTRHARRHEGVTLSTVDATAIVDAFEAQQASPTRPLRAPTTTDEALAILKSDRLDAFADVVAFLENLIVVDRTDTQIAADASLMAQAQLAWGEAELMIAEILSREATALDASVRADRAAGLPEAALAPRIAQVATWRRTDEALRLLAADHVDTGARNADLAVGLLPDDYVGYRVAADAARLTNRWSRFEEFVARVEAVRPDSNGLRFLRGVQAWTQQSDRDVASFELHDAVENDPDFIRARAWLVVIAPAGAPQLVALAELAAASPDHQIVRWAGPAIRRNAHQNAQAPVQKQTKP